MFTKKSIIRFFILVFVIMLISGTASASPQFASNGTGFTYQGKLIDGGVPANGTYDFQFRLFDALISGNQVGSTITQPGVTVTNGLFTVQLDFGNVFNGTALYLEIGVRPGSSSGSYTTLSPLQPLSPTPYALYTTQSGNTGMLNNQSASYYQNASNINSGTLGTTYFNAYTALGAEGYLNNAANNLALNNGTLQATLNADLLDGLHAASFALASHTHWGESWTGSGTGLTLSGGTIGLSGSGSTYGLSGSSTSGDGVYGSSTYRYGVEGSSSNSVGVYGSGGIGVAGYSTITDGAGIFGYAYNGSGNYAGQFYGNVKIVGNQTVTGTKSAVVKTQDYGTRTLYAVESPENWFQDFGTGQLTDGTAVITIDPVFAETVNLADDYHVFFTPMGDCALYVTDKTPTTFTVKALGGQTCSIAFDYNIVAKRLGYETVRLAVADTSPAAGTPNK